MTKPKKTETLTMRLTPELREFIESYANDLTKERGPGAKAVSMAEAAAILLETGKQNNQKKKGQ